MDLTAEQVFEARQTGEESGAAGYLSAAVVAMQPFTACSEKATVQVLLGFHIPITTAGKERTQRIVTECAIRDRFVWRAGSTDAIPDVGLSRVLNMGASETDDPADGFLMGGITWQFETILDKRENP